MIITDKAGNQYVTCNQCGHWIKRQVPRCDCPYQCHDMARRAAERQAA